MRGKERGIYEITTGGRRATSPAIDIAVHRYTVSRYMRRSKETNHFTFVSVAECLGTIYPDNIAAGTLFT